MFCATCWGLSYLAINVIVEHIPPIMGSALRFSTASLLLLAWVCIKKHRIKCSLDELSKIAIIGLVLQGIPMILLFWGEKYVSPALAGIIISSVPIFVVLFSFLLKHELEHLASKSLGVLIGFLGIIIIFMPQIRLENSDLTYGMFAVLGTAMLYALGNILLKKWGSSIDQWSNITLQVVISSITLWIAAFVTEPVLASLPLLIKHQDVALAVAYLGFFSSGLAWIALFFMLSSIGSLAASTVVYPMVVVTIIADIVYFKRPPSHNIIYGTLLIFIGIFITQYITRIIARLRLKTRPEVAQV